MAQQEGSKKMKNDTHTGVSATLNYKTAPTTAQSLQTSQLFK